MSDATSFAKLVPGFDFLQGLVKNAGAALPAMGQWVAPTLNPEELQKRIDELKTVQFWLEQNAKMLGTTIQALEVQRMTLSTLQTMNLQMSDLRDAMKASPVAAMGSAAQAAAGSVAQSFGAEALLNAAKGAMGGIGTFGKSAMPTPEADPAPGISPAPTPAPAAAPTPAPAPAARPARAAKAGKGAHASTALPDAATGLVDPMQWWGALTKQFTQIAAAAMKDTAADAAKQLAGAVVKQGVDTATGTLKKAASASAGVASRAMSAATEAAGATSAAATARKQAAAKTPARKTAARKGAAAPATHRGR